MFVRRAFVHLSSYGHVVGDYLSFCLFVCLLAFNITGEKGKKESKKDSKGDDDETASVTSHESSMVRLQ